MNINSPTLFGDLCKENRISQFGFTPQETEERACDAALMGPVQFGPRDDTRRAARRSQHASKLDAAQAGAEVARSYHIDLGQPRPRADELIGDRYPNQDTPDPIWKGAAIRKGQRRRGLGVDPAEVDITAWTDEDEDKFNAWRNEFIDYGGPDPEEAQEFIAMMKRRKQKTGRPPDG